MADKELEQMSLAELGRLFPIVLADYDAAWPGLYGEEKERIVQALGAKVFRIRHIGSTSVPGLVAKPTIDILLEIADGADTEEVKRAFRDLGYHFSPQPENPPPHMMFMKGYAKHGYEGQAYHVHVRYPGDWNEPCFRDYLRAHPGAAAEYAALKRLLQREHEHDREAYTRGKTKFIQNISALARKERCFQLHSP